MNLDNDPRPALVSTQEWVSGLIAGTTTDQLSSPTPCTEYDVRALTEHLLAVSAKLRAMAEGGDPRDLPDRLPLDESPADQYAAGAAEAMAAWADDELLTRTVTAPFGQVPGVLAANAFVMETVTHGWDLAVATGQESETDPSVVAAARAVAEQALGPGPRGPETPFADPVDPPADAGPTARLAAYLGRSVN